MKIFRLLGKLADDYINDIVNNRVYEVVETHVDISEYSDYDHGSWNTEYLNRIHQEDEELYYKMKDLECKNELMKAITKEKELESQIDYYLTEIIKYDKKARLAIKAKRDDIAKLNLMQKSVCDKKLDEIKMEWEIHRDYISDLHDLYDVF